MKRQNWKGYGILFSARVYLAETYYLGGTHWSDTAAREAYRWLCKFMREEWSTKVSA